MGVFDVPDVLKRNDDGTSLGTKQSSTAFSALSKLHSGDCQQTAFELVTTLFDTSRGLVTALFDKGYVSFKAMDVLNSVFAD